MITDKRDEFLKSILNNRKHLIELAAVGVLIGLGTSFLAAAIFAHFNLKHKSLVFSISGILLIALGFIYFILLFFGKKKYSRSYDGFFIFDRDKKEVMKIENYDFADKLESNIGYALAEDQALKKQWNNFEFKNQSSMDDYKDFYKIINEASEYYLIEKLSTHLSMFFNNTHYDKNEIIEYERNDISSLLLKNRFLELFSKPMEYRASFIPDKPLKSKENQNQGKVVASFANGAMFQHFDLSLPRKSKVIKNLDNSISIITQRFTLNLKSTTSGVNTYIPWEYTKLFLGIDKRDDSIREYVIRFDCEVIFNFGTLFKASGWKYYNWLDTFLIKLKEDFEQDYYFSNKIEWDKSYPIIKSLINNRQKE